MISGRTSTPVGSMPSRIEHRDKSHEPVFFAFAFGAATGLAFAVSVQVFVAEFAAVLVVLLLSHRHRSEISRPPWRGIWLLGGAWLVAAGLANLVNGSPLVPAVKDLIAISFLLIDIAAVAAVAHTRPRLRSLLYGRACGLIAAALVVPSVLVQQSLWKFGLGVPITLLLVLAGRPTPTAPFRRVRLLFPLAAVALNFFFDFRSLALISFLAVGACYVGGRPAVIGDRRGAARRVTVVALLAFGLATAYTVSANSGLLGLAAQEKFLAQSGDGPLALLVGGRKELPFSAIAVLDSPVVGQGSSPSLNSEQRVQAYQYLEDQGLRLQQADYILLESQPVPLHSFLFQAWVKAGIVGALFWAFLLVAAGAAILRPPRHWRLHDPLGPFLAVNLMWTILFSPFGAGARLEAALSVVIIFGLLGPRVESDGESRTKAAILQTRGSDES